MSRFARALVPLGVVGSFALAVPAQAQTFRFTLRAEPDVIPANGISTTSILVQVPQDRTAITQTQTVRFATTAGVIESQAVLSGGVARVLLRSSTTPETATITAFVGNARETTTVEFSADNGMEERYLEVAAPYVAYGAGSNVMTASGKSSVDFGDLHIESDVRLDVDLASERLWAQGNTNGVLIRYGHGDKAVQLQGDRLFYDLHRRRGVIRRAGGDDSNTSTGSRQEFMGSKFEAPPADAVPEAPNGLDPAGDALDGKTPTPTKDAPSLIAPPQAPTSTPQGRENLTGGVAATDDVAAKAKADAAKDGDEKQAAITAGPAPEGTTDEDAAKAGDKAGDDKDANVKDANVEGDDDGPLIDAATGKPITEAPAATPGTEGESTVAPGSLADNPAPLQNGANSGQTLVTPLVTENPKNDDVSDAPALGKVPDYTPLPADDASKTGTTREPRIIEIPPPNFDASSGYWVTAKRLRVFPRDKVQFERASIYFNGKRAYSLPLYVLPLDGSFDPTTDILKFNSQGGLTVDFPLSYMANKHGTGTFYLHREPGAGFGTQGSGLSLEMQQQYWLSPRSHGSFGIDQLGHGAWNLNLNHQLQIDPRTQASFDLNMPRHRDMFARAGVSRDLRAMQIGFESFYDQSQGRTGTFRGQFFARMRPKNVGRSGWSYTLSANALGVSRVGQNFTVSTGSGGGGIGLPGSGSTEVVTRYHSLLGQTLSASLQSPVYKPWRGGTFSANLLTTAFNYSDNRRGLAPGLNLNYAQNFGKAIALQVNYTYDRSSLGLYGATEDSFTHYVSASLGATLSRKMSLNAFLSKSLQDGSLYGSAGLDYYFLPKWRVGLFTDYSNFVTDGDSLNYGWTLGRSFGNHEVTVNYDALRGRIYFEIGQGSY